jgi:hypothetical protein
VLTASGTPRLTITDGNGGSTVLDLDFKASDSHSVNIPSDGIRVSDIYVSAFTNITAMRVDKLLGTIRFLSSATTPLLETVWKPYGQKVAFIVT